MTQLSLSNSSGLKTTDGKMAMHAITSNDFQRRTVKHTATSNQPLRYSSICVHSFRCWLFHFILSASCSLYQAICLRVALLSTYHPCSVTLPQYPLLIGM